MFTSMRVDLLDLIMDVSLILFSIVDVDGYYLDEEPQFIRKISANARKSPIKSFKV